MKTLIIVMLLAWLIQITDCTVQQNKKENRNYENMEHIEKL